MGRVWSTHVEMSFVFSMAWGALGQHMLRYILCPLRHVRVCRDLSGVLACMECVWSTHVDIHFVSSQAFDGFDQHKFR
jgi:hypothetical protein